MIDRFKESTQTYMIADQVGGDLESVTQGIQAVPNTATDTSEEERLKAKLSLANSHAKKAEKERAELAAQLDQVNAELQNIRETAVASNQKTLEGQGAFRELYEQEKGRAQELQNRLLTETKELKEQLETVSSSAKQERLKASAMGQISRSNAVNPAQLYTLLSPMLRTNDEGSPVVLNEGVEQPIGEYLVNLKAAPEWQHHFAASRQQGMGISPGAGSVAPGRENPYVTGNLTEAIRLEVENADLARALKAEAQRR